MLQNKTSRGECAAQSQPVGQAQACNPVQDYHRAGSSVNAPPQFALVMAIAKGEAPA